MEIWKIVLIKWKALKKSKVFYALIFFNFFLLAMVDTKSFILLPNIVGYIFRFIIQQLFIIMTIPMFVHLVFNIKSLDSLKNYMVIYVKDIRNEVLGSAFLCIIVNIIALFIGQALLLGINYIYYGKVYWILSTVNFILVSLEISSSVLLVMSLRMLFKKDLMVYGLIYLILMTMVVINNVFVTMPLTIKIVGIGSQGYYLTYGWQLWAGRFIILSASYIIFMLAIKKFKDEWKDV